MRQITLLLILWMSVMTSALAVVLTRYQSRQIFIAQVDLNKQRDALNIEWGRLQLEQNTWAAHSRIEQLAREQLNMRMPKASEIVMLRSK